MMRIIIRAILEKFISTRIKIYSLIEKIKNF